MGFALETNNAIENAKSKLSRKNLDFIVLNTMEDEGAGFAHDTNKVTIISKSGHTSTFPLKDKTEVASDLATIIVEHQQSINS